MIKTIVILALGLATAVLGVSTGYLGWQRSGDKAAIATLTDANAATNKSIREIVDVYNQQVTSGKVFSDGVNADLTKQLDLLVADYNNTSSTLATTKAQLEGSQETEKNFTDIVNRLNAANSRVAQLEAQAGTVQDIQKIVDQLNAANSKVATLEAELAAAKTQ